jgi:hypothetical protein
VAGFGAVPVYWQSRAHHVGTFDDEWSAAKAPFVPSDFSARFYQSAPDDQQVAYLSGGEQVSLFNLMPGRSEFRFKLPTLEFEYITVIEHSMRIHRSDIKTVIVEPDVSRLIMVWQTAIDCQDRDHLVDKTTVDCKLKRI